jgi:hypothetical protein
MNRAEQIKSEIERLQMELEQIDAEKEWYYTPKVGEVALFSDDMKIESVTPMFFDGLNQDVGRYECSERIRSLITRFRYCRKLEQPQPKQAEVSMQVEPNKGDLIWVWGSNDTRYRAVFFIERTEAGGINAADTYESAMAKRHAEYYPDFHFICGLTPP